MAKKGAETNGAAVEADVSQMDETEMDLETGTPVGENNKRKLPDQSAQDSRSPTQVVSHRERTKWAHQLTSIQEPPTKTRKVSSPPVSKASAPSARRKSGAPTATKRDSAIFALQMNLVENIADIESDDRQKVATAIVKMFVDETKKAVKAGSFSLPGGQPVDHFGTKLGLAVEYAIYLNYWGTSSNLALRTQKSFERSTTM